MKSILFTLTLLCSWVLVSAQNCGVISSFTEIVEDNGNGTSDYTFSVTVMHTSGGDKSVRINSITCGAYTFNPIGTDPGTCLTSSDMGTTYTFGPYTNVPNCTSGRVINYTGRTNASCGGTSCGPFNVTASPCAEAMAGNNQTVCASSPAVTLAGSITGLATSATWGGGAGTFSPNNSTLNATYTPTPGEIAAGTVTLTLTTDDPAGPCTPGSDQMTITINEAATANAGGNQAVCASNPTVTLAGSVGGVAASGTWSGGVGTFSPNNTTLNATYTPAPAEIAIGVVTLTLTTNDPAGICPAGTSQMTITIDPAASANAGGDRSVCASSPDVILAGGIAGAATSATWSGGAGTFNPSNTALNATYTPTAGEIAAGSVTLTLTTDDPAGLCPAGTGQMTITYNASPCVQVPTMGQWGLIILSLLLLTFGTVALQKRELAGANSAIVAASGVSSLPFNRAGFSKMLVIVMLILGAVFAIAVSLFGYEMTSADLPGSLVAGPLMAYLLHLLRKK